MILSWYKGYAQDNKPMWEAASPYTDEGCPYYFRIKENESGTFELVGDAETMLPEHKKIRFPTVEEAKLFCQQQCDLMVKAIEEEYGETQ